MELVPQYQCFQLFNRDFPLNLDLKKVASKKLQLTELRYQVWNH